MEEEDHRDDESVEGDEESDGNSKNRVSKEITELYYFILVLALNQKQLRATINKDTGKNMLKKAKVVVSTINNHMSNYWKEPEESALGKGREDKSFVTFYTFVSLKSSKLFHCFMLCCR